MRARFGGEAKDRAGSGLMGDTQPVAAARSALIGTVQTYQQGAKPVAPLTCVG